ncbi:Spy/CpxP family protein refolding chaperone [Aquimarina sp. 2201CG14-23]|uniref:Spy/CpxP family protein refolding chaperone n=1 Tax=Aquimarina mycalae TaxID=3040073 RepID=UPI00247800E0|nr:hypothetical protein [Aquimarina sp. 2201CG14-23]MDH7445562.1 hypothetical protein [Aquimarina sp. 2201CG14-23]
MKKNIALYILLVFLIIVNGVFLFMILKKPEKRKQSPGDFMAQELRFDEKQMKSFQKLNYNHEKEMRTIHHDIRQLKDGLFNLLDIQNVNTKTIDSITDLIGEKIKEKDVITFYHFKDILAICNEKQKTKFDKIVKRALHKGPKGPRRKHPPRPQ